MKGLITYGQLTKHDATGRYISMQISKFIYMNNLIKFFNAAPTEGDRRART